jgi:hypothetical protein
MKQTRTHRSSAKLQRLMPERSSLTEHGYIVTISD